MKRFRKKKKDKRYWTPKAQNKGNEVKGIENELMLERMAEVFDDNHDDLYDEEDLGPCGFLTDEGECLCHDGYCSDHEWCEKKL